ncbi:cellulose binding domain-containing protein [Lentzea sp. NBC_00516]|uniref:cellulose binding domain-containing protein n=1 Tax=Lentzea sp. NBC_00516 TaxID=2903582 RepID=UPI002E81093F|nr:cellulose binding domain-containing protein [Lentzea sp. NBC_00516]WUD26126.1 cellulose binding domain-containing protein [Lentzea sp. NBC_00516]
MSRHRSVLAAAVASAVAFLGAAGIALGGQAAGETGTAATAGCGKPPALTSGQHTINSGGQNRSYILRLPTNYDSNRQYRLFVGFHWRGGTANDVDSGGTDGYNWSYYGLRRLADAENNGTIFVAPQGNGNGWANPGGQDLRFVDDLVSLLDNGLCVDTTQRFAGGFSYGGGMSYAVACARANVFRAVVAYSGAQLSGCDGGNQPIGYMGIHGVSDNVLGIGLGRGLRDTFVRNNGCTPQNAPEPAAGSRRHIVTNYSGCRAGYPVVWAAFDGGHTPGPIDSGGDGWRTWTSGEAWKFLTQFAGGGGPTSTTTTTTTTPPPGGAACRVGNVISAWNNGLTSNITITNTGSSPISGWSLVFTLPGGQTITSGWSATYSPSSGQVTAKNVQYNGDIAPNASITVGFQATHTGNNSAPASYSLNGNACSVA